MATKKVTIKQTGKKPISFTPGGLHKSLDVAKGKKIPDSKMKAALEGDYGPKAKKQAQFKKNILKGKK